MTISVVSVQKVRILVPSLGIQRLIDPAAQTASFERKKTKNLERDRIMLLHRLELKAEVTQDNSLNTYLDIWFPSAGPPADKT